MYIEKPDYTDYLKKLEEVSGVTIDSFAALKQALINRMEFFNDNGCNVSDHGLPFVMYRPASEKEIEKFFKKRRRLSCQHTLLNRKSVIKGITVKVYNAAKAARHRVTDSKNDLVNSGVD